MAVPERLIHVQDTSHDHINVMVTHIGKIREDVLGKKADSIDDAIAQLLKQHCLVVVRGGEDDDIGWED
jgi:hypothetical protein